MSSKIPARGLRGGELAGDRRAPRDVSPRLWSRSSAFSPLSASRGADILKGIAPLALPDLAAVPRDGDADDFGRVVVFCRPAAGPQLSKLTHPAGTEGLGESAGVLAEEEGGWNREGPLWRCCCSCA